MGTMVNNSPKNTMIIDIILDRTENDGYTSEDILHYEYMYGEEDYFKAFKEAVKNQDEKAAKCALIAYSETCGYVVNDVIEKFNWVVE